MLNCVKQKKKVNIIGPVEVVKYLNQNTNIMLVRTNMCPNPLFVRVEGKEKQKEI